MVAKRIDTINIDLSRKTTSRTIQKIGEELVAVRNSRTGREYNRRDRSKAGRSSGLTIVGFFEHLFIKNELLGCMGAPLTNPQIEHALWREFPNMKLQYISKNRMSIGLYRNRYMKRTLFAHQAIPMFVSLRYDEQGYIVQSSRANRYMTQDQVLELCHEVKIADPRFFPASEIMTIAAGFNDKDPKYLDWHFPSQNDLKSIKTQIKKDPFGCMRFPEYIEQSRFTH